MVSLLFDDKPNITDLLHICESTLKGDFEKLKAIHFDFHLADARRALNVTFNVILSNEKRSDECSRSISLFFKAS